MNILRMIPRNPINRAGSRKDNRDTYCGQCPNCMSNIWNITPKSRRINYCRECGQAIKWY